MTKKKPNVEANKAIYLDKRQKNKADKKLNFTTNKSINFEKK